MDSDEVDHYELPHLDLCCLQIQAGPCSAVDRAPDS